MVGKSKPDQLDRLIDEVARGRRDLRSVKDERMREAIRVALRIHQRPSDSLDDYTRLRIRARVLGGLRPHGPTLADHAWTALELLARPAPLIARGVALTALLVTLGLGATVASADTLPDDLLYPVKVASESVRLALAAAPEDRAEVELSIAEHRLGEAERLATSGRTSDALVAAAVYSQHIAWAAAELAPGADTSDLPRQLETRFAAQRDRAQTLASALANDAKSAPAARILSMIAAPTIASGTSRVERVADTAAGVAAELVKVAEQAEAASASLTVTIATATRAAASTPERATTERATTERTTTERATTAPSRNIVTESTKQAQRPSTEDRASSAPSATPQPGASDGDDAASSRTREAGHSGDADAAPRTQDRSSRASAAPDATARPAARSERSSEVLRTVRKALEEAKAAADKAKKHR